MNAVVHQARCWIGTPYRHQAATLGAGCDCLGLIRGIWRALYGTEPQPVPPYGADWRIARADSDLEDAARRHMAVRNGTPQPGDVLLFALIRHRPPRHCGILVEDGHFIHAQEQVGVVEVPLSQSWRRRIAGAFVFPVHGAPKPHP